MRGSHRDFNARSKCSTFIGDLNARSQRFQRPFSVLNRLGDLNSRSERVQCPLKGSQPSRRSEQPVPEISTPAQSVQLSIGDLNMRKEI